MEDRYLYKAKRINNGEWEIGSLAVLPNGDYEICNKCKNPPDSDPMWNNSLITHKVDSSTICQYTGLTDKNGKKIWENDIVKNADSGDIGVIKFGLYNSKHYGFYIKWVGNFDYREDILYWRNNHFFTIVGNALDNPELLEGELK